MSFKNSLAQSNLSAKKSSLKYLDIFWVAVKKNGYEFFHLAYLLNLSDIFLLFPQRRREEKGSDSPGNFYLSL